MTQDTTDTSNRVRISRTFEAPRDILWRMWTVPSQFASWYGPDGATVHVEQLDLQPGGRRVVHMTVETPGGPMRMSFRGEFREVVEPERLVYTEATDGHEETLVEVVLREDGDRTTVDLTHHGIPAGSPGEAGWLMALDHLESSLSA